MQEMQETRVCFLGWEDPLEEKEMTTHSGWEDPLEEKEMTTHSGILSWEISWTEESGGLQSIELQRIGHDLAYTQ